MEETKPVEISKNNFTGKEQPQPLPIHSKKRKLSNVNLLNSSYFKIRALVRQLRPQFIQVLQTPDFKNCQAAHELRIQMKLLMELYKQMTMETDPLEKVGLEGQPLSGQSVPGKQSQDRNEDGNVPELLLPKQPSDQSAEKTSTFSQIRLDDGHTRKSYIVGGSVFGWNFITYGGSTPVYYGVTKESFRNTIGSKISNRCIFP